MAGPRSSSPDPATTRAACLTPPGAGGIAVIQVVGPGATRAVSGLIDPDRPLDLDLLPADCLRLRRLVDGEETIDDAVVAVRHLPDGQTMIDLAIHGGPRVVQRCLMRLREAGARMVQPLELLREIQPAVDQLERDLLARLPEAKTPAVARWMVANLERYRQATGAILEAVQAGDLVRAHDQSRALVRAIDRAELLLRGVRVVLIGAANVGKSTLANALAGRDHSIVSDVPGTTRDWLEHAGAIEGVPFTFVDTAGLRDTSDLIEAEAIRRAHGQLAQADLAIHVRDASTASSEAPSERSSAAPRLSVLNKCDLPTTPAASTHPTSLRVSGLTGEGLPELRGAILSALHLTDWPRTLIAPPTPAMAEACRRALSALAPPHPDARRAEQALKIS